MLQSKRCWMMICGIFCMAAVLFARGEMYDRARTLVSRVQDDLRRAASFSARTSKDAGKEHERYSNAQHHLSDFDRNLVKDKFDRDKLNQAIDDVKNVVENNTLTPEDRDALTTDLQELRVMRSWHEH